MLSSRFEDAFYFLIDKKKKKKQRQHKLLVRPLVFLYLKNNTMHIMSTKPIHTETYFKWLCVKALIEE